MNGKGNITDLYSNDPEVAAKAAAENPNTTAVKQPVTTTGMPITEDLSDTSEQPTESTQETATETASGLSPEEQKELAELQKLREQKVQVERESKLSSMSKEDLVKYALELRQENASKRIKAKEVKNERDQISEFYDSKFNELTSKIKAFEEKASAYDELIEKQKKAEKQALEEQLSLEEKLSHREAEIKTYEQKLKEIDDKYKELDSKYKAQLEEEQKKRAVLEAKAQAEQKVYKEKTEALIAEIPDHMKDHAWNYIKGSQSDWREAYGLMLKAKQDKIFGKKDIHVANDTPSRNNVSDSTTQTQQAQQPVYNPYGGMMPVGGHMTPVHSSDTSKYKQRESSKNLIKEGLRERRQNRYK